MRNLLTILVAAASCLAILMSFAGPQNPKKFYYAFNEQVPLIVVPNKVVIRYSQAVNRAQIASSLRASSGVTSLQWKDERTVVITTDQATVTTQMLQQSQTSDNILTSNAVYALGTGLEIGVTDELLIHFLPSVSLQQKADILKQYELYEIKNTKVYQLFRIKKGKDVLTIANSIQESGLAEFSYPNFISNIEKHQAPNDEFFTQQFNLLNTGQVLPDGHAGTSGADIKAIGAWKATLGSSNIIVAVLDEGVTSDHPDLPNSRQVRLNGSNFADGNPNDPSPTGDSNHGNSCAGLIAATQGNAQGISGVAPNCKIMPIRIFNSSGGGIAANRLADAIMFAANNGADVISNSWGYNSPNPNLEPVIVNAIRFAVTNGRGGRGCVVAFSAGNTARRSRGDNGFVAFPANVNIPGVLTVGASDRNDQQSDYSPTINAGSNNNQFIDVTAPSHRAYPPSAYPNGDGGVAGETFEVWSIDIPNSSGYNPWPAGSIQPPFIGERLPSSGVNFLSYTGRFGGTSAACPQIAGIAALVLSVNPNFTQQQVFDAITGSADKVGGYAYSNGRSNELGYGRANACRAVLQSLSLSIAGANQFCSGTSSYSVANSPANFSYTWSSSNTNTATIDAASGVATAVGNGLVTFTATSSTGCGISISKTVQIGPASSADIVGMDPSTYFSAGQTVTLSVNEFALGYNWSIYGGTIIGNSTDQSVMVQLDNCFSGQTANNDFDANVTLTDGCGTGRIYHEHTYAVCNGGISPMLSIASNPASSTTEVFLSDKSDMTKRAAIKELKVVDSWGTIKYAAKYEGGKTSVVLDISSLPNNLYTVSAFDGKRWINAKLVKN